MTETSLQNPRRRLLMFALVISILFSIWLMARIVPDVRRVVSTIELLLFIPLPLAIFYVRSSWARSSCVIGFLTLIAVWFFTYSLLHEVSHIAGDLLLGKTIVGYQLIPHYWKGEFFSGAGVSSASNGRLGNALGFLGGLAPYMRDVLLLTVGYWILRSKKILNPFLSGLIFTICCLSSLFDIVNNYSIYLINPGTVGNDFQGTDHAIGTIWTNTIGVLFTSFSVVVTGRVLVLYRGFPAKYGA